MKNNPLEVFEVMLRTETVEHGLKNLSIDYALPKNYIPDINKLNVFTISRTTRHSLYDPVNGGISVDGPQLIAGYIYRHTDQLLEGLPSHAVDIDPEAVRDFRDVFISHLGTNVTRSLVSMLSENDPGPRHSIICFNKK